MTFVIDASAATAWIAPSQATKASDALLSTMASTPGLAPAIFAMELRNALLKLERRGVLASAQVDRGLTKLGLLVRVADRNDTQARPEVLLALARAETLSVFDAAYLELAIRERAEVASRDGALLDAAQRRGLAVRDLR
jgi:predicted nucleic acid-binding protein